MMLVTQLCPDYHIAVTLLLSIRLLFMIQLSLCSQHVDLSHALSYSRNIWMYYEGNMFDQIEFMFRQTLTTLSSRWDIYYLTPGNLSYYIPPDELPVCWNIMTPQTKSDYIRLTLLMKYGGWWIDSAIMISDAAIMDVYLSEVMKKSAQLFACCVYQCPTLNLETNFIYAPKGSSVIYYWHLEFRKMLDEGRRNYQYHAFRKGVTFSFFLFEPYPLTNIYMSVYVAQQVTLQRLVPRNISVMIKPADQVLYSWYAGCTDMSCFRQRATMQLRSPKYPVIKISGWIRKKIWAVEPEVSIRKLLDNRELLKGLRINRTGHSNYILWLTFYLLFRYTYLNQFFILFLQIQQ